MPASDGPSVASFGDRSVRYTVQGRPDGPVLILSNSLGTNFHLWDRQVDELATRWRVVRYDTRGHGGSSAPAGPYTITQLGADVVQLLDFLGVEQAAICGVSLGGLTALHLAATAPDRFPTIAICNAIARFGTTATWAERIATVRRIGMEGIAPSVIARWFTEAFRARCPDVVKLIEQQLVETPAAGYIACCEALRDTDLHDVIPTIRARAMVLAGTYDPAVPVADARWIATHLQSAHFVELPTAHLSNVETPAAFTEALSTFLAG
jgi:3-oxoadipate enol-lactonase